MQAVSNADWSQIIIFGIEALVLIATVIVLIIIELKKRKD
jgi:hypothetical protein